MLDLSEAASTPFSNLKRALVFFILSIPPLTIITFIWTSGYLYDCLTHTSASKKGIPEWTGFWRIFLNGVLMIAVFAVCFTPGLGLYFISQLGSFDGSNKALQIIMQILSWAIIGIGSLISSAAIVHAAKEDAWKEIFSFMNVGQLLKRLPFLQAWLIAIAISTILYWGTIALTPWMEKSITHLALFALGFGIITTYTSLFSITLFGQSARESES